MERSGLGGWCLYRTRTWRKAHRRCSLWRSGVDLLIRPMHGRPPGHPASSAAARPSLPPAPTAATATSGRALRLRRVLFARRVASRVPCLSSAARLRQLCGVISRPRCSQFRPCCHCTYHASPITPISSGNRTTLCTFDHRRVSVCECHSGAILATQRDILQRHKTQLSNISAMSNSCA